MGGAIGADGVSCLDGAGGAAGDGGGGAAGDGGGGADGDAAGDADRADSLDICTMNRSAVSESGCIDHCIEASAATGAESACADWTDVDHCAVVGTGVRGATGCRVKL